MDEIVLRAMAKWPNVPSVYGWLRLDRRGDWWIKDERVRNQQIIAFIGRNYTRDDGGRWFFQNGPQRVFAALDYAPFVFRVNGAAAEHLAIVAHTGRAVAAVDGAWLDEDGALLLEGDVGIGVVDDRDLDRLVPLFVDADGHALAEEALDVLLERLHAVQPGSLRLKLGERALSVGTIRRAEVPARFGFVPEPESLKE